MRSPSSVMFVTKSFHRYSLMHYLCLSQLQCLCWGVSLNFCFRPGICRHICDDIQERSHTSVSCVVKGELPHSMWTERCLFWKCEKSCLCFAALLHQGTSSVTKWSTQERSHICATYVGEASVHSEPKPSSVPLCYALGVTCLAAAVTRIV